MKPNIVNVVSIYTYRIHQMCIITIIIPVSDNMCEGSGGSCTGMRSLDGVWTVSGRTASFVGVVSAIP